MYNVFPGNVARAKTTIILIVVVFALAIGAWATISSAFLADSVPRPSSIKEIPQDATSSSAGVTFLARGAIFSGTETILRLEATLDDALVAGNPPVSVDIPKGGFVANGFAGKTLTSGKNEAGELLLVLPPLVGPDEANSTELTLNQAVIRRADGPEQLVAGNWQLTLRTPAPGDIREMLRIETSDLTVAESTEVTISARLVRSASQTLIEYSFGSGMEDLSEPLLFFDGEAIWPQRVDAIGEARTAVFANTPFGAPVTVEFGQFAIARGGSGVISVKARQAFDRINAPMTPGGEPVPLATEDTVTGDKSLFFEAAIAQGNEKRLLVVSLRGSWATGQVRPRAIGADGNSLRLLDANVSYPKASDGSVGADTTRLRFEFESIEQLQLVTFLLDGQVTVVDGPGSIRLEPKPEPAR